jgi:hypothetical protein
MLIVAVVDEVDMFANVFWLVMVAVKPVTLLQPEPAELFVPATKLTAAHYDKYKSAQTRQPEGENSLAPYLVQFPISGILQNLQQTALTYEFRRHLEVGNAEIAETNLMHDGQ